MNSDSTLADRPWRTRWWFCLLAALVFCSEALGYAAGRVLAADPPAAWLAYAGMAALAGAVGAAVLDWLVLTPHRRLKAECDDLQSRSLSSEALEQALAERDEWQKRLRHDLRGALSPALLTADRLLTNEDPKVKRAGSLMVQAVQRATALMAERES